MKSKTEESLKVYKETKTAFSEESLVTLISPCQLTKEFTIMVTSIWVLQANKSESISTLVHQLSGFHPKNVTIQENVVLKPTDISTPPNPQVSPKLLNHTELDMVTEVMMKVSGV